MICFWFDGKFREIESYNLLGITFDFTEKFVKMNIAVTWIVIDLTENVEYYNLICNGLLRELGQFFRQMGTLFYRLIAGQMDGNTLDDLCICKAYFLNQNLSK